MNKENPTDGTHRRSKDKPDETCETTPEKVRAEIQSRFGPKLTKDSHTDERYPKSGKGV